MPLQRMRTEFQLLSEVLRMRRALLHVHIPFHTKKLLREHSYAL